MQAPESIEETLSRLMPPALSATAQQSIEAMLDDLQGDLHGLPKGVPRAALQGRRWRWSAPAGIAAAAVALAMFVTREKQAEPVADIPAASSLSSGLVLIGESDRIEQMTEEGWTSDPDGRAMKAVWMRVVEESSLRDERTGIVLQITQPREEMVLIPVSSF